MAWRAGAAARAAAETVRLPFGLPPPRPNIVLQAAAHKDVSFMGLYPEEAGEVNVLGSRNLLEACEAVGVDPFVFVSTDKAVRPTNVMGVTKRVAELAVREAGHRTG